MQRRTASRIWIYDKRIAAQSINGPQQVAQEASVGIGEEAKKEDQQVEAVQIGHWQLAQGTNQRYQSKPGIKSRLCHAGTNDTKAEEGDGIAGLTNERQPVKRSDGAWRQVWVDQSELRHGIFFVLELDVLEATHHCQVHHHESQENCLVAGQDSYDISTQSVEVHVSTT